jgi:hypothetical protein
MKRWLETQGYALCVNLAVLRVCRGWPIGWLENVWAAIWYRYYCPRPAINDWTARACVNAGYCGCNNHDRYAPPPANRGGEA